MACEGEDIVISFNSLAEALLKVEGVTPRVGGWVGGWSGGWVVETRK